MENKMDVLNTYAYGNIHCMIMENICPHIQDTDLFDDSDRKSNQLPRCIFSMPKERYSVLIVNLRAKLCTVQFPQLIQYTLLEEDQTYLESFKTSYDFFKLFKTEVCH